MVAWVSVACRAGFHRFLVNHERGAHASFCMRMTMNSPAEVSGDVRSSPACQDRKVMIVLFVNGRGTGE